MVSRDLPVDAAMADEPRELCSRRLPFLMRSLLRFRLGPAGWFQDGLEVADGGKRFMSIVHFDALIARTTTRVALPRVAR